MCLYFDRKHVDGLFFNKLNEKRLHLYKGSIGLLYFYVQA